jgi:hypothetical protein
MLGGDAEDLITLIRQDFSRVHHQALFCLLKNLFGKEVTQQTGGIPPLLRSSQALPPWPIAVL